MYFCITLVGHTEWAKWEQLHCFSQKESAVCVHVFVHGKKALQYRGQHSKSPHHLHRNCLLYKIALPEQLEQYLNDLLPSCFGVQFRCPFPKSPFLLALHPLGSDCRTVGRFAREHERWVQSGQMTSITPCRHTTDTLRHSEAPYIKYLMRMCSNQRRFTLALHTCKVQKSKENNRVQCIMYILWS